MFVAFLRFLFVILLFRAVWAIGRRIFRPLPPRSPGSAGERDGEEAPFGGAPVEDAEWEEVEGEERKSS